MEAPPQRRSPRLLLAAAVLLVAAGAAWLFIEPSGPAPRTEAPASAPADPETGAYHGDAGWVLKLPPGYVATRSYADLKRTIEIAHFAKAGTDPSSLLDEGLYGGLGIVRVEARPSAVGTTLDGLERFVATLTARAEQRKEKYTVTHLRLPSLRGVQIAYNVPFPRVEAYVVSDRLLFAFYAGQDDEIYRTLLQSLRDTRAEL